MKRSSALTSVIFACLLSPSLVLAKTCDSQDQLRNKVSQLINLPFPRSAENCRKQLKALGAPAIPYIIEAIRFSANINPIKKDFLADIISSIGGGEANSAFIELLSDSDSHIRGLAASYIGKRRLKSGIPQLINLLNDKGVYKTIVQTDPSIEQDVFVRDVVIESLQSITGITLAHRSSRDEQAKAWLRWWHRQERVR